MSQKALDCLKGFLGITNNPEPFSPLSISPSPLMGSCALSQTFYRRRGPWTSRRRAQRSVQPPCSQPRGEGGLESAAHRQPIASLCLHGHGPVFCQPHPTRGNHASHAPGEAPERIQAELKRGSNVEWTPPPPPCDSIWHVLCCRTSPIGFVRARQ